MAANTDVEKLIDDVESTLGYISIKDFAYDENNPLRYGYVDDTEESILDNTGLHATQMGNAAENDSSLNHSSSDSEADKRNSIVMPQDYIINQNAVALYDFEPENDNELPLLEGDHVFISYRHGQGWLVAETLDHSRTGLVPEEFVEFLHTSNEDDDDDNKDVIRPFYLTKFIQDAISKDININKEDKTDIGHSNEISNHNESKNNKYDTTDKGNELISENQIQDNEDEDWEDIDDLDEHLSDSLHISKKTDNEKLQTVHSS